MHVAENGGGWQKWLGEYPTLSATPKRRIIFPFEYALTREQGR